MNALPLQRLLLQPAAGQQVVADHLPGMSPGYLYLHGMGSVRAGEKSSSLFSHASAQGRAASRFDFRGHGESSGDLGAVPIRHLVDDTLLLLGRLGPSILVGSSLGGLVAALVAARHPGLVRGLALIAPALGFMQRLEHRLAPDGSMQTSDGRRFVVTREVLEDARQIDESGLPQAIHAPTLIVHGTADEVVPFAQSIAFHAGLAATRKQLWLVPDGDHRLNTFANAIWPRLDALLAGDHP